MVSKWMHATLPLNLITRLKYNQMTFEQFLNLFD